MQSTDILNNTLLLCMEDRVTSLSHQLKTLISKYHFRSFIAHFCFLSNGHWRQQTGIVELKSPVRQLIYLMTLHHSTGFTGQKLFHATGEDYKQIISLLNEIETCYGISADWLKQNEISTDEATRLFITNSTFLNYYFNAPLGFFEQDIERIKETFKHFETHITESTGLIIQDFIDFFSLITNVEVAKYSAYFRYQDLTSEEHQLIKKSLGQPEKMIGVDYLAISDLAERRILGTAIPTADLMDKLGEEKAKMLLALFTLFREESDYLYYTDTCEYLTKPILMLDGEHIALVYSKQLITAIYERLHEICAGLDKNGAKVRRRREEYLEFKTEEVFRQYFGDNGRIFSHYYVEGTEKDLLILQGSKAYIVECKANKYRIPFRDPVKAYQRIRDDFNKSIGKGYEQANEVEELFYGEATFPIRDECGKIIETIDPAEFDEVFTIVVTQERFGQIQCDLSFLLNIKDDKDYPWSVSLDDLETFLITLKRKPGYLGEFPEFLLAREKLQGRLYCFDELELCSYFLFEKADFINKCARTEALISSPDMHLIFDNLYEAGLGFKEELNLSEKLKRKSTIAEAFVKRFKLAKPDRIREFISTNNKKREN